MEGGEFLGFGGIFVVFLGVYIVVLRRGFFFILNCGRRGCVYEFREE